ncbi:head-tail adaptor protein [Paracoccus sp. SSK6]|uniref:head-tail adaptor protein n=1 Tax=Paracoccus sp. SSK6 TaxID=3143131 RepID=UPI00321B6D84
MTGNDLCDRVILLEPFKSKDEDGRVIQLYQERGAVWANIQHRPGSEAFQQARMEAKDPATIAVEVDSLTQRITSEWRIETPTRRYEVKGNPFLSQDRQFLIMQVEGHRK